MEPKTIILVRHGESIANRERTLTGQTDPDLTRKGKSQAKRTSRYIKRRLGPIDRLYTSPLKRARQTAEVIATKAGAPLIIDGLLMETNFGSWEGLNKRDLSTEHGWEEYLKDPFHYRFPGGESPQDVKRRVHLFRNKLFDDGNWSRVVVVSHYTPIVFFLLRVIGNGDVREAPFRVDNASLSVIEIGEGYELLSLLNYSP